MVPVLALPLQDQVDEFGGYIGIAAFFGLAVLTVLYFAQAREVKRLREWAGRSPERALDLEERVLAQAEQARKARPQPVPQAVAPPAAAAVAAAKPVAKPAVAAVAAAHPGTKVHPAAAAIPAAATAAGAVSPAALPASGNGESPTTAAPPAAPPNGRPQEGPVTVTGAPPAAAPPVTPTPGPAPAARPAPAPALPPRPAPPAAPAARRAPATYGAAPAARRPANRDRGDRSTTTLALIAGAVAVALAGLVFLGTQLLGGDDPAPVPNQVDATATPDSAAGAVAGQSVEEGRKESVVAVLNGTTSSGLAASIAERLESEGYPQGGKVETGPDQTVASTIVYYAEGKRAQARDVAKLVGGADVSPMDPDNQALAGANAKLLVIVGSDKAPSQ